jgi:hypothetical protein
MKELIKLTLNGMFYGFGLLIGVRLGWWVLMRFNFGF